MTGPASTAEEIFERARLLPRAEVPVYLSEACAGRDEVRAEVQELLDALHGAEKVGFLPGAPASTEPATASRVVLTGRPSAPELLEHLTGQAEFGARYSVDGELARGGMGAILAARDVGLHRPLAMKVALPVEDPAGRGSAGFETRTLARFLDEAQVTAQLDHPGIVPVHELGVDPRGQPYFTMKRVDGRDLRDVFALAREGREDWTVERVLGALLRVCEAMAYAHHKGVVHRDLKPANVMVGRFGEVYVMDWGLAHVLGTEERTDIRVRPPGDPAATPGARVPRDERSPAVTMDGDVLGTPAYMPPEQARGELERIGPASDVYAVGAMLYDLLAGRPPYVPAGGGVAPYAVWARVKDGPPESIDAVAPGAPPEVRAICAKAMERSVERRYADMEALAADLRSYLEGRVVSAHASGALTELRKWVRRNPAVAALTAVVLVSAPILVYLGVAFVESRPVVVAATERERAETVSAHVDRGFLDLALRDADGAMFDFRKALDLEPRSVEARAGLAIALVEDERPEEAREVLETHPLDALALDEIRQAMDDFVGGLGLEPSHDVSPFASFVHGWAALLQARRAGDPEGFKEARKWFDRAIRTTREARAIYHGGLARVAGDLGDLRLAREASHALRRIWPGDFTSLVLGAYALKRAGSAEEAVPLLERAVELEPDAQVAHYNLGNALYAIGEFEKAIRSYDRALEIDPEHASSFLHRGQCHGQCGHLAMEEADYRRALTYDPNNRNALYSLADFLYDRDMLDDDGSREDAAEAVELLTHSLEIYNRDADVHYLLGLALDRIGDSHGFAVALRRSFELTGDVPGLWKLVGVLEESSETEQLIETYQAINRLAPDDAEAHWNLAVELRDVGKYRAANEALAKALDLRPEWGEDSSEDSGPWDLPALLDRLVEIAGRLDEFNPDRLPAGGLNLLALTEVAHDRGRHRLAAHAFRKAETQLDEAELTDAEMWSEAAVSLVEWATQDPSAVWPDWRATADRWLAEQVDVVEAYVREEVVEPTFGRLELEHLKANPSLAPLREAGSGAEASRLWERIDDLLSQFRDMESGG